MTWTPSPLDQLVTAERLDRATGRWHHCLFEDLRNGDVFRTFFNGQQIDPREKTPVAEDVVALACADAIKDHDDCGFCVEVEVGPLPEILRMATQ